MEGLSWLNGLPLEEARAELLRCCGSTLWAQLMESARPFRDRGHVFAVARTVWQDLSESDWKEAFAAHPRIGDRKALSGEQAQVAQADAKLLDALAEGNAAYERRFGHIFIVCATGKSAQEMLDLLQARLNNEKDVELRTAAAEQAKITELRLRKLLESHDR